MCIEELKNLRSSLIVNVLNKYFLLAEVELIFLTVDSSGLCFGFGLETMLITERSFPSC